MNYYIIRFGYDNPVEIITDKELVEIYNSALEFDGFTGLTVEKPVCEQDALKIKKALPFLELIENDTQLPIFKINIKLTKYYCIYNNIVQKWMISYEQAEKAKQYLFEIKQLINKYAS